MKIEIPDELTPESRKKLLKILPIRYAVQIFKGNKTEAALWLGLSPRGLRIILKKYEDLEDLRGNFVVNKYIQKLIEDSDCLEEFVERVKSSKAYIFAESKKDKVDFLAKVINIYKKKKGQ